MKIVLLGPPGAGKGTQAELLQKELGIPHIATGDMLRVAIAKGDSFGQYVADLINVGQFVSDEVIIKLVKIRIAESDSSRGFILDGFPRTKAQAEALEQAGVALDFIIQINVPDDVIVHRLAGRRVHIASGRIYHIYSHPPRHPGIDDITDEPLVQRPDDEEDTVRKRLRVYHEKTEPLIGYYKQKQNGMRLISVDGTQDENKVCTDILEKIQDHISSRAQIMS